MASRPANYPFPFYPRAYTLDIVPRNIGVLASMFVVFAIFFENLAFLIIYIHITIYALTFFNYVFVRSVLYFRPDLREKAKESIRKRREAQKLKDEAKPKPSALTRFFYYMLWPLMIINGSIFQQREEGTPIVEGAMQRFVADATTNCYVYVVALIVVLIPLCLGEVMASIFRATRRSRIVETPAAIEEGTQQVKGGISGTAANYLDEPMPKLVDVDEPAFHTVEPATRTPVDLL